MAAVMLGGRGPHYTHYCHQCHRSVRVAPAEDVVCPDCQGGFVEEISTEEDPMADFLNVLQNVVPRPAGSVGGHSEIVPATGAVANSRLPIQGRHNMFHMIQTMTAMMQTGQGAEAAGGGGAGGGGAGGAGGAGNVEIFFDNGTGTTQRRFPGHFGDYFFGAEFDQLLQQLAENDNNRYGAPPASKAAVEDMPKIKITEEHVALDSSSCAVCKEDFELGVEVRQMPCKHMYHEECIMPWLNQHNSCPVCRFELATDDPDYNLSRGGGRGRRPDHSSVSPPHLTMRRFAEGGGRPVHRRFSFFPWLIGANTEASGSGGRSESEEYDSLQDVD